MSNDPYRAPGHVETDNEKYLRLQRELESLWTLNSVGRPPEEIARISKRCAEIQTLLLGMRLRAKP